MFIIEFLPQFLMTTLSRETCANSTKLIIECTRRRRPLKVVMHHTTLRRPVATAEMTSAAIMSIVVGDGETEIPSTVMTTLAVGDPNLGASDSPLSTPSPPLLAQAGETHDEFP